MPELSHALRRETKEPRDSDELRQRLALELLQLCDLARLDEFPQPSLDAGAHAGKLLGSSGSHERGDVGRRRANQLRRLPVGAYGVVAGADEVEQSRVGLEPLGDRRVLHSLLIVHIVVPYRGENGKRRLDAPAELRARLAFAMLQDVLAACVATAPTLLVTDDVEARAFALELGAETIADPGGGQGEAVAAALAQAHSAPVLVVNADLPCAVPRDLRTLAEFAEFGGLGLVEAADGTTNALALPQASLFAPLFGPGSAARFRAHGEAEGVAVVAAMIPNLADDVDTLEDLERVELRAGPRTQAALEPVVARWR
jgi:2-phospho-L-lactate guanylyltransferase